MPEVFEPRANMIKTHRDFWECLDENGNLICDGGPSIIWDEGKGWQFWVAGLGYHRLDGPTKSTGEWFINNKDVTKEIKKFAKENDIFLDKLTEEDKVLIILNFS